MALKRGKSDLKLKRGWYASEYSVKAVTPCKRNPAPRPKGVKMSEGVKLDDGKLRMDLISPESMEELAKILTYGATKYEDRNWEKGILYSRVYAALLRHLVKWSKGEVFDTESGLRHLSHAFCNLMFLVTYDKRFMNYKWNDIFNDATKIKATSKETRNIEEFKDNLPNTTIPQSKTDIYNTSFGPDKITKLPVFKDNLTDSGRSLGFA